MRSVLLVAFATSIVFVAAACEEDAPKDGTVPVSSSGALGDGGSSGKKDSGSCVKDSCESVSGACGRHDDKCGGTFSCGDCPPANPCVPLTCDKLQKTCGIHDDACGTTVNCGACATSTCAKDVKEPNEKKEQATNLGPASDYDNVTKKVDGLKSSDGDEDWFTIQTTDGGFGGNPLITATVTDATLEVTIFHVCKSQPDYSACNDADKGKQDDLVGKGCRALGTVALATECTGLDESGDTYIRVRKTKTDEKCQSYDLTVKVE